jgi:hypothetical protein
MTLTIVPGGEREPAAEAFRTQVSRFRQHGKGQEERRESQAEPPTAYEMVTRQMVEMIAEDVRDIRGKLNNLLFVLTGAVLVDIISRAMGA